VNEDEGQDPLRGLSRQQNNILRCYRNDKGRRHVWNNANPHERRISKDLGEKPPLNNRITIAEVSLNDLGKP